MAESIWAKGRLREVFEPAGKRADGERRFRRANFDLLEWASVDGGDTELYVVPLGYNRVDDGQFNVRATDFNVGAEFGYYSLWREIVEAHESDGKSDTWKSLHSFGPL